MRGEHLDGEIKPLNEKGSSPHARGALEGQDVIKKNLRIIPACAGSTEKTVAKEVSK